MLAPVFEVDNPQRVQRRALKMTERNRSLSSSEQKAIEVVLKLMKLKMVPTRSWNAIKVGRVSENFDGPGLILKRCQFVFEWKREKSGRIYDMFLEIVLQRHARIENDVAEHWNTSKVYIYSEKDLKIGGFTGFSFRLENQEHIEFLLGIADK